MDAARRAVPRDLRRRAHRHRPRRHRRLPRGAQGAWPPSAWSPSRTRSSSASSSPTRTARIERFLEKPTWGQVFSDTINTGIFVLEPEIFDYIEADRPVDFSERGLPRAARRRQAALRRRRRGLLGGRRHARGLRAGPQGRPRRQGAGRHPRLRAVATACGWARAPRSTPTPRSTGPAVIGDNCRVEAGARLGEYAVLGTNVRVRGDADARAHRRARQRLPRRGRAPAGHRRRPGVRPAQRRALRGGRRPRRRVLRRRGRPHRRRASRCTRSRPSRPAPSSTPRSSGSRRGARSLFGRDGVAGLANVDITPELAAKVAMAYGTHAQEGRHGRHVPRLEPLGPHAQAGDDGRAQRRRRQRRWTSRWPRCRSPGSSSAARRTPAASPIRLVEDDPQSVIIRFFDADGARHHRGHPAQDRAALRPRGLPPGVRPARSATSASPPRALEHYAVALEAHRRRRAPSAAPSSRW